MRGIAGSDQTALDAESDRFGQPDGRIAPWFVGVFNGVVSDKYAIGIMGHATIGTNARVVSIQGETGGPYVMPIWETVQSLE
jgi:hypothetical protein